MPLSDEELRAIGKVAAEEVIGNLKKVEVATGLNEDGDPAYFFELSVDQSRDRAKATLLRTRLRQKIRDLLLAKQDARYPYVRIFSDRG